MAEAIEISNLYKQYKGSFSPAVNDLSLKVAAGSITGLLGPNGAGKSTTINMVCGLITPDKGTVTVFGKNAISDTVSLRYKTGVVPQQIALFGNLSALENFLYIGRLYGLADTMIKERANKLLARLDLERHADKRIGRYSGGMKRRANIIASLLHQPELLILDEPTAGVDVQSRAMIIDFLQEYHRLGNTILYTSHLLHEAEKLCDAVVIIDEGKLIAEGNPKKLIRETTDCDTLEAVFLHHTGHSVRE